MSTKVTNEWTDTVRTDVSQEEIAESVEVRQGLYYSKDGMRLVKCMSNWLKSSTITIKEGSKVICDGAFKGCKRVSYIILPDSVTHIGIEAFADMVLYEVRFSQSLKVIGVRAFQKEFFRYDDIIRINFTDSAEIIGDNAFC